MRGLLPSLRNKHSRGCDLSQRGDLTVVFVVRSIETSLMKVSQRQNDLVKIKLQRVVLHRDLQTAVSGMFVLAGIIRECMRGLCVRRAAKALFGSRLGARFLSFQTNVE